VPNVHIRAYDSLDFRVTVLVPSASLKSLTTNLLDYERMSNRTQWISSDGISHRCKIAFPHRIDITAVLYRLEMRTRFGVRVHFNEAVCAPRQWATVHEWHWSALYSNSIRTLWAAIAVSSHTQRTCRRVATCLRICFVLCTEYCRLLMARSRYPLHMARNLCIQL